MTQRREVITRACFMQMFGRPKSKAIQFSITNSSDATVKYTIGERTFELGPHYIRTHTRCRPAAVKFRLPGDKSKTIEPASGDRLVVTGNENGYQVKKE